MTGPGLDTADLRPPTGGGAAPPSLPAGVDAPPPAPPADAGPQLVPGPAAAPAAGPARRARWERPALAAILGATAVLYLWGLSASGWGNSFYSAAAQAGSVSWKTWLFGSSDAANSITVDKPPASLWVAGLSVRIFGLSSWSVLAPQALMGVATVAAVWHAVRRWFSAGAAVLASVAMAVTPVAVLMFRFNNPDALLVLLMTLAAVTTLRGIEDGRRRWVAATGALVGLGFLTKQLQVLLVVPPLAAAHLWAAPGRWRRRLGDLLVAGATMIVTAGWWVALVELWPAGSRPYIGGSQNNSILELTFGYNGFGRLTGDEVGSVGGGPGGIGGRWGETGITRMVDGVMGGQIAWLLPAALVLLAAGLWLTRRAPRTDRRRASLVVWGGWLVVTALTFSYMAGIFHEYYTVALAPPIAVLVGAGAHLLWRERHHPAARLTAAAVVVITGLWSASLLGRAPDWTPWLAPLVTAGSVAAAIGIATGWARRGAVAVAASAVAGAVCLVGPAAWSLQTAATPHAGAIVTAGPAVTAGGGGPGGGRGGFTPPGGQNGGGFTPPGGQNGGGFTPPGGQNGGGFPPSNGQGGSPGQGGGGPGAGMGGLLDAATPSDELVDVLLEDADRYTWAAAAVGANTAAGYQLATEESVMPIGGFNGTDPSPTLEQFQQYVEDGRIHWFIESGGFGRSMGGSDDAGAIAEWVTSSFESVTVDGVTLYDLTQPIG
jgi:4-amino-4-deoxy-L-arabinose transferase-like glycosyltransferase